MRPLLLLVFFGISFIVEGQIADCDQTVEGNILDLHTNEPLPFATIGIVGTDVGAVADENGRFIMHGICEDEIDLEVQFVGYKTFVHHHDFHHPTPTIFLAGDATVLESIVIEEQLNAHELETLDPVRINVDKLSGIGTNSGELFSQVSGIGTLKTGQNIVKPMVHGLHSNRVLIINNGVRHSYQAWGNEHGVEIDASQIDRIRLIKGASTVRYGSDALGGVILFDAPSPSFSTAFNGEVNGGVQSNGRAISGELFINEGYKRAAWSASISGTEQGDLKAANYQLTNTGKEEFGITAGGKFHFSAVDMNIFISHFDQKLGILRGSVNGNLTDLSQAIGAPIPNETKAFSYDINNPRQETTHDLLKIESSIFVGEQQFDFQYAYQRNLRKEFDVRRGTNNDLPAIDLQLQSHSIDLDWDHPSSGEWSGTLGLQLASNDNDNIFGTNTIPFIPNYNTYSAGIFGIESIKKGNMVYEVGVRFDLMNLNVRGRDTNNDIYRDNLNYNNFTFTFGILKEFNENVSIRSNVGTAWRAPNVNELYSFGKHQSIIEFGLWRYEIFTANDSISTGEVLTSDQRKVKSERAVKWITSLNIVKDDFQMEVTPHINFIQNYFFLKPNGLTSTVRGTFPYFIHAQTNAVYSGIDIDIRKQWSSSMTSELKSSYVYAVDTKSNQPFVGIPPFNIQMSLTKRVNNFSIALTPEWTARQTNSPSVIAPIEFESSSTVLDDNEIFDFMDAPSNFFLLNVKIGYERDYLAVEMRAQNLLNKNYRNYTDNLRYFADDTGINVGLFASYSF
ncbi:MAG: TonB-dependent receptor [Cytophagales bacterium]|nr:TonB-dependent receptor [Cytophagales bacterium]